jgi:murein DD-endopeptidase MepM/ murein hydrolase activator NlpD
MNMIPGYALRRRAGTAVLLLALGLGGCAPRVGGPAPLVEGGAATPPPPARIVVQRGQSLSEIAHSYHVPLQALAQANNLSPPYRIRAGQGLAIPGGVEPPASRPAVAVAALPSQPPAVTSSPRPLPAEAAASAPASTAAPPPPAEKPTIAAAPLPAPDKRAPPSEPAAAPPEALHPPAASPAPPPPNPPPSPPPPQAAAPAATASAGGTPSPAPPAHGGEFQWPVRGRVVEGFGAGSGGTRNDGINIAAPRGAAVQAADAGVVAYAGNELRGYGNLILVKHPGGWISAYAHCDLILVKKGEKVGRGQVIARVGSTGNVGEPQLHFELRRGNKPVDPREYLAPLPTATAKDEKPG